MVRAFRLVAGLMPLALALALGPAASGQRPPRARDLGVPFEGLPGPGNAITDVAGVTVGHSTIVSGEGPLRVGQGPVRTGVTAVLPRGRDSMAKPSFAGWYSQNGNGEMTGTTWVEESGFLEGPVMITNTHSVGVVRDAVIAWRLKNGPADASGFWWSLPVVAETYDGALNDINGFHVKERHVFEALDSATGGPVREGNAGGGTGMIAYGFKGGIGTSSRVVAIEEARYTVGVLVQANFGRRPQLMVAGVPVGKEIPQAPQQAAAVPDDPVRGDLGSIIIVVATDAPLLPHQLKRLSRRATLGMGPHRRSFGQRLGRHLHRVLHRQPRRLQGERPLGASDGLERADQRHLRRDGLGHRGSHHQRHGRGRDDDRRRQPPGRASAARRAARRAEEVQPPDAVVDILARRSARLPVSTSSAT